MLFKKNLLMWSASLFFRALQNNKVRKKREFENKTIKEYGLNQECRFTNHYFSYKLWKQVTPQTRWNLKRQVTKEFHEKIFFGVRTIENTKKTTRSEWKSHLRGQLCSRSEAPSGQAKKLQVQFSWLENCQTKLSIRPLEILYIPKKLQENNHSIGKSLRIEKRKRNQNWLLFKKTFKVRNVLFQIAVGHTHLYPIARIQGLASKPISNRDCKTNKQ